MLMKRAPKEMAGLFSLTDQPRLLQCWDCGSRNVFWYRSNCPMIWPRDIRGYVEPTAPVVERDDYGPITTRTVRCR
jgi:hypothetical protein